MVKKTLILLHVPWSFISKLFSIFFDCIVQEGFIDSPARFVWQVMIGVTLTKQTIFKVNS